MIIAIFKIGNRTEILFTTDYSVWYYMKPIKEKMWKFETLGM